MASGVMRTRKDGGMSICYAKEENVGKKKCCHVLDDAAIEVRREKGINFIDITGKFGKDSVGFSVKANEKKIRDYISNLTDGLTKKEQTEVLNVLRKG